MKINAITRINEHQVRSRLDDYGLDGTFSNNGDLVSGTMGTITKDELAFRIWRQSEEASGTDSESRLREIWKNRLNIPARK